MKSLMFFLIPFISALLFSSLSAQIHEQNKYKGIPNIVTDINAEHQNELYFGKKFNSNAINRPNRGTVSLTEPVHFPYQGAYSYYQESLPVLLENGQLLLVWVGTDSLKCAHSSDEGVSWGIPIVITTGHWPNNIAGLRTSSNRVLVIWHEYNGIWMTYSDDNGFNWSAPASITYNQGDIRTTISKTLDGKLWLLYSRLNSTTHYDLYYRTSIDDGESWSSEEIFYEAPGPQNYGMVVSGNGDTLLATFEDRSGGNWELYLISSSDGGVNWSTPRSIINSTDDEHQPRLLRQSNDDLWLIYYVNKSTPILPGYMQSDIYYTKSIDGGNIWETPTQFTFFAGDDTRPNVELINNQPFISFASFRWERVLTQYHIWYGLIGTTEDNNPPPIVFNAYPLNISSDVPIEFQAFIDDESGIADVRLIYSLNGASLDSVQMYDDGLQLHNDENAGDNIWCGSIGPFQIGDFIWFVISATDLSNITINVESGGFYIPAVHDTGNIILNFLPNSQLADEGVTSGSNAYWPIENGNDYLCQGGLWIGTDNLSEYCVMNIHYYEKDWTRTDGTEFALLPGTSDQDGNATFDDRYPQQQQRIGLQVHQQSYQWRDSTCYDFIIFEYTIQNTGENGNLSNLYASVWLDPDVGDANNDLAGFDQTRSLIYMYNSQGIPDGYFGLKLLGEENSPHTARAYNNVEDIEPYNDYERFQCMTSGFPSISQTVADYRIILTAQPFNLAINETHRVTYGIVLGHSLGELQVHADTMEAIYNRTVVSIEDFVQSDIPTNYSLAQNYPNPFNPSTKISWQSPVSGRQTLKVYDVLGKKVVILVDEYKSAGSYEVEFDGSKLPSGVYFYQLKAGEFLSMKKMLLLK